VFQKNLKVLETYNTHITIECYFAITHKITDSAEAVMMMMTTMTQTRASKCVNIQRYKVSTGCWNSVSWQQILRSWSSKTWCHIAGKCAASAVILEVETRSLLKHWYLPINYMASYLGSCNLPLEIWKQNLPPKYFILSLNVPGLLRMADGTLCKEKCWQGKCCSCLHQVRLQLVEGMQVTG